MKRGWLASLIALIIWPLAACGDSDSGGSSSSDTSATQPVQVVTTVGMIRDVVANVGGDCVQATSLMGPGVDPHLYRASSGDVRRMREADIIFYGGHSLEGKLGSVLKRLDRNIKTIAVSEAAHNDSALMSGGEDYAIDPHLWMEANLWAGTIPVIADALIEQRPGCKDHIRGNEATYRNKLTALNDWIKRAIQTVPKEHRYLVTAHDAFGYYGRAYAIEVVGIQGISTASAAGVGDIQSTVKKIIETGVPAIFVESTINPRTIQSVVEAARNQGHDVSIGGELYSDAMGERGTAAGTYIGMLHANTRTIVKALGGNPPALPETLSDWAREWNIQ